MATLYPSALDTTAQLLDTILDTTPTPGTHAGQHNNISDAILAVETALGTNPFGTFSTVVARLNNALYQTPGASSQVVKPSADAQSMVLRPFSDAQTHKIVEYQNASGSAVTAYVTAVGGASFASLSINGTALASTNLSDAANIAYVTSANTFTLGQTISANAGLTLSGNGGKATLALTNTGATIGLTIGGDTNLYRNAANQWQTDHEFRITRSSGASSALTLLTGANVALQAIASGKIQWADGAGGSLDTNLYRGGGSILQTDSRLNVTLDFYARFGASSQVAIGAFGPGSTAGLQFNSDANAILYRSGAGTLNTVSAFTVGGAFTVSGASLFGNAITLQNADLNFNTANKIIWQSDTNIYRSNAATLQTDQVFVVAGNGGKTTLSLTNTGANTGLTIGGDTTLYRSAASSLKTDSTFIVGGLLALSTSGVQFSDGTTQTTSSQSANAFAFFIAH